MEQWLKIYCPHCDKPNWVSNGDPQDMTVADIGNTIKCFNCKKCFLADEDFDDGDGLDEDDAEEGLEQPN